MSALGFTIIDLASGFQVSVFMVHSVEHLLHVEARLGRDPDKGICFRVHGLSLG